MTYVRTVCASRGGKRCSLQCIGRRSRHNQHHGMDAGSRNLGGPRTGPSRQAQAQSIRSGKAPIRPSYTFGVSCTKDPSTSVRETSGSEGEVEATVMELEPRAAVVRRGRAPTPMDEDVNAKIMQLPVKEQRRSFLKMLPQGHYVAIGRLGGCYRVPHVDYSVFSFVGTKLPSDSTCDLYCRRCWSASAPTDQ